MKKGKEKAYIRKNGIYIFLAENKRLLRFAFAWGIPFAASCVLGWRLDHEGTVFGSGGSTAAYAGALLLFLLETAALSIPAALFAAGFMHGGRVSDAVAGEVRGMSSAAPEEARVMSGTEAKHSRHPIWRLWLLYSLLIFFCWVPVFLAYYPSVFAYDAEGQLYQVLAGDYSTHHPLLHTLFLGAFFRLGIALGSCSAGMAVHSAVQMALMAGALGWALAFLCQRRVSGWVRMLLLLFFAFFPANPVLAVSTTKDVLFAALVLLYTLCFYQMVCDGDLRFGWKEQTVYAAVGVLMLLLRNNAVYAFAVSIPIVYTGLAEKRRYLRMTFLVLVLFGVCSALLKAAACAQSGSPREMLSVPLQQMARTRVKAEEEIDPFLRQELEKYIPAEWVFAAYNPHLADPVKNRAVIHDDPAGLIKTWIKLGLEYPSIYIDAFLDNSLGLWYLWDTSHARVYGIGTESGFGYLSTDNRAMPAGYEVEEHSLLPGLRAFVEKIVSDNAYSRIPVVRLLFAPALYWWLLYFYLITAWYRKKYRQMLPAVFPAAYCLTLLLSPTVLVRYIYPIMITIPVILPCLIADTKKDGCENIQ